MNEGALVFDRTFRALSRRSPSLALLAALGMLGALAMMACTSSTDERSRAGTDALSVPANLVLDPSFEGQTIARGLVAPWFSESSGAEPLEAGSDLSDYANSGDKSAFVYAPNAATATHTNVYEDVPVKPGTTYHLKAFVRPGNVSGGTLGARAADGTVLGETAFDGSGDYRQVALDFSSGNATTLRIYVGITSVVGQASAINLDDVSLTADPTTTDPPSEPPPSEPPPETTPASNVAGPGGAPVLTPPADAIDVRAQGAKGDGAADDTVAIENAIRACREGGAVVFPSGTYRLTRTIGLKANCAYYGRGNPVLAGHTGTGGGGFPLFESQGSNITVYGLTLAGGGIALDVEMQSNVVIVGNTFRDIVNGNGGFGPWQAALFIGGTMIDSTIEHNAFTNIFDNGNTSVVDGWMNGIHGWRIHHVKITANTFDRVQQGMSFSSSQPSEMTLPAYDGNQIVGNVFTHVRRMAIEMQNGRLTNTLIQGNTASQWLNAYWNSFGISFATDGSTGGVLRDNTWESSGFGHDDGDCMEIAGIKTVVANNRCSGGHWSAGIVIGGGPDAQVSNNVLCGGGFGDGPIGYEPPHVEASGHPATLSGNQTLASCP